MTVHSHALTKAGLIAALSPAAASANPRAIASGDVHEGRRRLSIAIELYGNDDALARRVVLSALVAGRPAFWTMVGYHSQKACILQLAVHAQRSIEAALDHAYSSAAGADVRLTALDTLVPINQQAVEAIAFAYAGLGEWRDIGALRARSEGHTRPSPQGQGADQGQMAERMRFELTRPF